jgi:hypothetical protein
MIIQRDACALHAGQKPLHAHTRMYTPTRPGTNTHSRARTHTYAHTEICDTAFPRQQLLREGASVLRYTYIVLSC